MPRNHYSRHYIQALSQGPVVYLRTLKCASTFFHHNFQAWGWEEISYQDIDWDNQLVFSHILEPVARRHKGIAEFIDMTGTKDLLFNDSRFQRFVAHAPLLDVHSASYHDYYGQGAWLIDWILLTSDPLSNIRLTERFLKYALNQQQFPWDFSWQHVSTPDKKQIEKKVIDLWQTDRAGGTEYVDFYLERDLVLYQTVTEKFSPEQDSWPDTSWLKDRARFQ